MQNDIRTFFEERAVKSIKWMVGIFEISKINPEEIANHIKGLSEILRGAMLVTALSCGFNETADKIIIANDIIAQNRMNEFKKSVEDGTEEQFLSKIPWTDKSSLLVDMRILRTGVESGGTLTQEEQKYSNIIKSSIDKDIEKEALSKGFQSVEEWKKHNREITSNDEPVLSFDEMIF